MGYTTIALYKPLDIMTSLGITYLHKPLHHQNNHEDTCSRMILWYWYSWHQRGSCEQDCDAGQITDLGNIRLSLNMKDGMVL